MPSICSVKSLDIDQKGYSLFTTDLKPKMAKIVELGLEMPRDLDLTGYTTLIRALPRLLLGQRRVFCMALRLINIWAQSKTMLTVTILWSAFSATKLFSLPRILGLRVTTS